MHSKKQQNSFKKDFRVVAAQHVVALFFFLSPLIVGLTSCQPRLFNQAVSPESDDALVQNVRFERQELLGLYRFDRITPTGEKIFAAGLQWVKGQELEAQRYAKPAQCANNVSRVFEMAGLTSYSSPLLLDMVNAARRRGGLVLSLPKDTRTIARLLEENFAGSLPVGTLVSGCLNKDCSGEAGDGHISFVGHVDSSHQTHLWHNNWYRPENRPWRPHMIPLSWYQSGFLRKWMSTPWMSQSRNVSGALVDVGILLPEIDDLDPTNYYVTLTIIPEILNEMRANQSLTTDGFGAVMPFRSVSRRTDPPLPLPDPPVFSACNSLRTISPTPTNLRVEPNGRVICKFPLATMLERVSNKENWTEVKGICPDGRQMNGFVLSALVVPACEQNGSMPRP